MHDLVLEYLGLWMGLGVGLSMTVALHCCKPKPKEKSYHRKDQWVERCVPCNARPATPAWFHGVEDHCTRYALG
jgi:hypothetical protein